jgi:hypothetical protein
MGRLPSLPPVQDSDPSVCACSMHVCPPLCPRGLGQGLPQGCPEGPYIPQAWPQRAESVAFLLVSRGTSGFFAMLLLLSEMKAPSP